MKLRILGTRGEIPLSAPRHENHSGMLIDDTILIDFGEVSYATYKPQAIFITHLHPDHAIFMRGPCPVPEVPIYAPERRDLPFLKLLPKVSEVQGCRITAVPTKHSARVVSRAFLIESKGKRVLYTGDLLSIDKKYLAQLGMIDVVVTEASAMREGGIVRKNQTGLLFGHAGVPDLVRLFAPHTKRIILTHFGSWFMKDVRAGTRELQALGKTYGADIAIARDGEVFLV